MCKVYTAILSILFLGRFGFALEPNEILISGELYNLVSHFVHAETVGPVQVKGREKWVMVHRIVSLTV